MGSKMTATAGGQEFKDVSWNGVVSRVVSRFNLKTTVAQRVKAAGDLRDGNTAYIEGVRIVPKAGR